MLNELLVVTVEEFAIEISLKVSVPLFTIEEPLLNVITPPDGTNTEELPIVKTPFI